MTFDILPAEPPATVRRRGPAYAVVGVVAAAVLVGGGLAAASYLGGGGAQPEDVLPASTVAMAKVDLDPSAAQKVAIYRLAKKFPKAKVHDSDSIRDDLMRPLFADSPLNYDKDVKPWLGKRAAVAALPDESSAAGFAPVAAVSYTDKGKAKKALDKAARTGKGVHFAFTSDGYVLLAEKQSQADAGAAAKAHLAEVADYRNAVATMHGDRIVTGWADLALAYSAIPAPLRERTKAFGGTQPTGQLVVGARAGSDFVEVEGHGVGMATGLSGAAAAGAAPGTDLLRTFPRDVMAAVSMSGLGESLSRAVSGTGMPYDVIAEQLTGSLGRDVDLPKTISEVFGSETAAAMVTAPTDFVFRTRGGKPDAAVKTLRALSTPTGSSPGLPVGSVERVKDGVVFGADPAAVRSVVSGQGGLSRSPVFRAAAPDAAHASFVLFVDVANVLRGFGQDDKDVKALRAIGMTAKGGADGAFRLRVTFR